MQSAGVWARFDDGVATERLAPPDLGHRRDARGVIWRFRDRVIDHEVLRRMTAGDREVAFVGLRPRLAERARGFWIEREQHRTGGAAIEPMHRVHPKADRVAHALQQCILTVIPPAMCGNASRFRDDDTAFVAMQDHFARCSRKKSICTCWRAIASFGSGTMCVPDNNTTFAVLPAT